MNIAGIITEFNPMHKGHMYFIDSIKSQGADGIVCVMSGNFVQRGDAALFNKFDRAECAVNSGVDIVIELPVSFSLASAEKFAYGAVYLLNSLGCVNSLFFGSECGNINKLKSTASEVLLIKKDNLLPYLNQGMSFARARAQVLDKTDIDLISPNDILAVEYLKALNKCNSPIIPKTIKRIGSYHDDHSGFAGAETIRKKIFDKTSSDTYLENNLSPYTYVKYKKLVSDGYAPADIRRAERSIITYLRTSNNDCLSNIYGITEGLHNRIIKCAAQATTLEELYSMIKTKRYTMTGIRRAVLCSVLNIQKNDNNPEYIRLLALNKKGAEILKIAKKTSILPIISSLCDAKKISLSADMVAQQERCCGDFYASLTPTMDVGYKEYTNKLYYTI